MRRTIEAVKEETFGFDADGDKLTKAILAFVWVLLFPLVILAIAISVVRFFVGEYKWAGELRKTNYKKYLMEVL